MKNENSQLKANERQVVDAAGGHKKLIHNPLSLVLIWFCEGKGYRILDTRRNHFMVGTFGRLLLAFLEITSPGLFSYSSEVFILIILW
jgi:hypothetical protein